MANGAMYLTQPDTVSRIRVVAARQGGQGLPSTPGASSMPARALPRVGRPRTAASVPGTRSPAGAALRETLAALARAVGRWSMT